MQIVIVHAVIGTICLLFFSRLQSPLIDIDLNLDSISWFIALFIAILLVVLAGILALVISFGPSTVVIHVVWILSASWMLNSSARRTWHEIGRDDAFFSEEGPPGFRMGYRDDDDQSQSEDESQHDAPKHDSSHMNGSVSNKDEFHNPDANPNVKDRKPLYTCEDMKLNGNDIRLLKLVPGDVRQDDHQLNFDLIRRDIHEAGKYTALSYCWGRGNAHKLISVNGREIKIRLNLFAALHWLAKNQARFDSLIWVDDICIDQSDQDEQSKQVLRVKSIFTSAAHVLAWTWTIEASRQLLLGGDNDILRQPRTDQAPRSDQMVLHSLLRSKYWGRMWIIQEFAVAANVEIHTGYEMINVNQLFEMIRDADPEVDLKAVAFIRNAMTIRTSFQRSSPPCLLDLLLRTSSNVADWRKDRVFGLLSMARDGSTHFLPEPSYKKDERTLSLYMTRMCLRHRKPLDIILLGPHFSDLPSWCPNYFRFDKLPSDQRVFRYVCDVFDRSHQSQPQRLFSATNDSVYGEDTDLTTNEPVLRIRAKPLGRLISLGWIASDESSNGFPTRKSLNESNSEPREVAIALWDLLQTLTRRDAGGAVNGFSQVGAAGNELRNYYKSCTYPYIYFMLLVFAYGKYLERGRPRGWFASLRRCFHSYDQQSEQVHPPERWYAEWLYNNQGFFFGERTLQQHAATMRPVLGYPRFWQWAETIWDVLSASVFHAELRDWKRLNRTLKTVAQEQMRLTSITMGKRLVLGLAHSNSLINDEVFLLPGCSVPVILRKADPHRYTIVGDAIIPGAMFGEQWEGFTEQDAPYIELV